MAKPQEIIASDRRPTHDFDMEIEKANNDHLENADIDDMAKHPVKGVHPLKSEQDKLSVWQTTLRFKKVRHHRMLRCYIELTT